MVCKINHICFMSLSFSGLLVGYLGLVLTVFLTLSIVKNKTFDELYNYPGFSILFIENATTSVLLIIGTKNKSALMVLPWVIFQGIPLGVFTYYCLYFLIGSIICQKNEYTRAAFVLSTIALCVAVIGWYVWLGILSFFRLLWEERNCQPQWDAESHCQLNVENQSQWNAKSQPSLDAKCQPKADTES